MKWKNRLVFVAWWAMGWAILRGLCEPILVSFVPLPSALSWDRLVILTSASQRIRGRVRERFKESRNAHKQVLQDNRKFTE